MITKAATNIPELPISGNVTENAYDVTYTDVSQQRIAELAYFKAEKRGFEAGHEAEDWLEAESEVLMSEFTD